MSYEDWRAGTDSKMHCSWNLHMLLPKNIYLFILLSSICGIAGQGGQADYAAGTHTKTPSHTTASHKGEKQSL
ncbi:hypothetical protein HO173_011300 [Letharia columbiana]|uniref:Ketoreductase (KR) domain-containing protein n=1 Tax=Letharia columbiana TaxID=112416 RepID=A0A8H6FJI3_9LECA|nr:uncharacterized protein HO173_011300 [Letharia columbiana]KAF6229654.1 hypothetical protein HO173_011300 [Letharia columbiana]